ncbi:hypothetical protein KZI27_03815 [Curtobacterium sp. TC1]|uniref:Ig-like domain-containing protein n=1 Tax=Curtobacterium sp. TC1 TaxID=2862880 RepID=UPI001C9AD0AC|nr:Ig-like domain-containing protein [Curtobacterium sp. TC1]QZQ55988.1 hypothetical protein KZI27_03815 [Curtobacterium sp. TC1]
MSHKKRASTAFKSIGAAGLAAATIVSGLSFGLPAASATPPSSSSMISPQATKSGKFVLQAYGSFYAVQSDLRYTQHSTLAAAKAVATTATFTDGTGPLQIGAQCVSIATDTVNLRLGSCSNAHQWVMSGASLFESRSSTWRIVPGEFGSIKLGSAGSVLATYDEIFPRTTALTASVTKVNNIAKSAVIGGVATPNGTVTIGAKTVDVSSSGTWSMTVEGLSIGSNPLVAVQKVKNAEVDQKPVTVTVVEGGTLVATDAGPIALERDGETEVPFIVQNNETRSNMVGTVTLDAPKGTTFAEGQTTVAASYRSGVSGDWKTYSKLDLTGGDRSEDGKHLTFTLNTDGGSMVTGEQYRYILKVNTPENAPSGSDGMDFVYAGDSTKGDFRAEGKTTTTIETAPVDLVAEVRKQNNIAKTADIGGTATPGAKISIGDQEVQADETTGEWSITVPDLVAGPNELTVVQTIDGTKHDEKKVTATIVEGGTLVGVDQGPITLERGESTPVPFVVENRELRNATEGTVTIDAPEGTTFDGQTTVQGAWRNVGATNWSGSSSIPLTNGRLSNDDKTLTFDVNWAGDRPVNQQYRFLVNVTADAEAEAGTSAMEFDFPGTSSKGDFRAQGSTSTTIENAAVPAPAPVVVTSPENGSTVDAKRPVLSGTGDEGATIEVRGKSGRLVATATVENGTWSAPADFDLTDDVYTLDVFQTPLQGTPSQTEVTFRVATNPLTTELTAEGAFDPDDVTKPATISGDATTGATVIVKDSLGNEVGRAEAKDGRYSIPVPPSAAHTGVNDFTVTQTKNDQTSPAKDVRLDYGTPQPIRITSPEDNSTVQKQGLTFAGTGDEGARIDVRGSVRTIATGTVENGTWTAPVTLDLPNNVYNLFAVQTTKGGLTTQQPITITITDEAPIAPLTATARFNTTDENLPAQMTGTANPGATITIRDSKGDIVNTGQADNNGGYTVTIPADKAHFGVNDFTVTQTVRGQVSPALDRPLDYGNPAAPVIQTPDNGDTVTNGQIRFTGTGATGAKLDMRGNTSSIGDTTITDGAWTVDVTRQLNPAVYDLHALQTSKGGLTQRTDITVTIQNEAPIAPLTATARFNTTDENLPAQMTGTANPGATITIRDSKGDIVNTGQADNNGGYTVTIPADKAHFGVNDFTVTQTVRGQVSPALDRPLDYGNPAAPVIQTPDNGDTVTNGQIRFTGTGATGAKLDMRGNTSSIGDTTITDGAWTVDVTRQLNPAVYDLHALQTSKGGLTQRTDITVTIQNRQIVDLTATGTINDREVEQNGVVSGNAETGSDVVVREGNTIIKSVKAVDGEYSVEIPATVPGVRTFTVTQTVNGEVSAPKTASLDYGTPTALAVETPAAGDTLPGDQVVFTGTGQPGAKVFVGGTVSRLGSATVNDQGNWSVTVDRVLAPQDYTLYTKQITKGNLIGADDIRTITVTR